MLFNSQVFICGFLPIVLALYYACAAHRAVRQAIVVGASLFFYGWWDVRFVPLLAGLTVANWLIARWFAISGARTAEAVQGRHAHRGGEIAVRPATTVLARQRHAHLFGNAPRLVIERQDAGRLGVWRAVHAALHDDAAARRQRGGLQQRALHVRAVLDRVHPQVDLAPGIRRNDVGP